MSKEFLAELYFTGEDYSRRITPEQQLNICTYIASRAHTVIQGLDLTWSVSEQAPNSFEALVELVDRTHNVAVSADFNNSPLLPGWFNLAFRAWHDACHWASGSDFSLSGECDTAWLQMDHDNPTSLINKIIFSEVVLQACAYFVTGDFAPGAQRVVLVPDEVITDFVRVGAGVLDIDYLYGRKVA